MLIVPGEAEAKKSGSPPKQKADVQQPAKSQRQQASKTAKGKPDDDDDDDGSDGKNDTGAGRVDRSVTGNVNAKDATPPDNLVDWWRWVTRPRAAETAAGMMVRPPTAGPIAANQGRPGSTAPTPAAAEAKAGAPTAAEDAQSENDPATTVRAPQPDRGPEHGRPRQPSEKATNGKSLGGVLGTVRSWVPSVPPQPGSYKANEVLGLNLAPAARERLRQLGYETREGAVAGLTHIMLRDGLDEWAEKRKLEAEFQQGFALNILYDHYRNALDGAPMSGVVPAGGSVGCSTERCYGRRVIGWRDHLAGCAKGVKVGVIDTGYDASHPAFETLKAKIVMEDEASKAPDWHGTGVLSLLAGGARSSTPGLIPDAEFLIADAFFKNSFGRARTDTARVLEALDRLERHGAQIINMSLAGPSDNLVHDRIVDLSMNKGVVFIAAAGNGGPGAPPGYPAAYKEVIAVTAIDDRKHSYDYANRGRYIDVAAPGVRIWTALPDNKEGMLNGTSFAAPFVTAIAAVTYNSTSLRADLREGRMPLDPKGAMLATFAIEKLGSGERSDQYGLGLVKAPSTCKPAPPPAVTAVEESPAAAAPWQGQITRAVSYR